MNRLTMVRRALVACALTMAALLAPLRALAADGAFRFAVMSDTQWKSNLDGKNPNTVAVGIIDQLNAELIRQGAAFVIQVGDLTDNGSAAAMDTRAAAAQALYDAGIGFFPLRGNHESSTAAALQFEAIYPQTRGLGPNVVGAAHFTSPFPTLGGLSYAFDYGNARFVLLDQFNRTDGMNYLGNSNNNIVDQLDWIGATLRAKPEGGHAFVFSHKGLITENHTDVLFGANPAANAAAQNVFIAALQENGVRYVIGGHDHTHNRALVVSPDGASAVQNIIASSNSYKFYIPLVPSNDDRYDQPARETELSQELFTVGYYLVTVDGTRVTVDHYASPNGCNGDCDLTVTPTLTFSKRETFGYDLVGKTFLVHPGESYTVVSDAHAGTTAAIVDGAFAGGQTDYAGRPLSHLVTTGWGEREAGSGSSTLYVWGMATAMGSDRTDVHALAIGYDPQYLDAEAIGRGGFGLVAQRADGTWVNAVELSSAGAPKYVNGPYQPGYALGTYGVDPSTKTAWAVLDYTNAHFAVRNFRPVKNSK